MITINAHSTSLMAQNNLNNTQDALSDNMMQLSTGSRINSASDDAAGMQITNRMETQISGLDQAQRNANDAISMAQTAEGAMQETTDILNRTRDLALQSANGTNADEDRTAIQAEVDQLEAEINDIASNTNFAGISLLDGSASEDKGGMTFQVGAEANETINFSIENMSASSLGGDVTSADVSALFVADNSDASADTTTTPPNPTQTLTIDVEGSSSINVDLTNVDMDDSEAVMTALNEGLEGHGITAGLEEAAIATPDDKTDDKVILSGEALEGAKISATDTAGQEVGGSVTRPIEALTGKKNVDEIDLTDQAGAQEAITILDGALAQVDAERANLGATQNRLESKVDNMSNIEENMSAAQSQMLDADFAQQTTEMTSNQMLMQSGASVLGQAKSMPQYANMLMG